MIVGGRHLLVRVDLLRFPAVGAACWNTIEVAAHVGDDVHSIGSPVGSVPLSLDGEDGARGLLLYVIDCKMGTVFRCNRAGLSWNRRCQLSGSEKQPQRQAQKQLNPRCSDFTVNPAGNEGIILRL